MSFFRNPEIKRSLIINLFLTAAAAAVGFIIGIVEGVFALCLSLTFTLFHFIITFRRYKKIAELSREIDRILHGKETINLNDYCEGELAILKNGLSKLTVQLKEQAEALNRDKIFLSDSIADISHQIRTPLTSINLVLPFLSKPGISDQRRFQLIQELEMLLSRIDWLISTLLKISKLDAGTAKFQQEPVSVAELMNRAFAPLAIPFELREQQFDIQLNGNETFIGDLSWSVEAIQNILKNCMEHTPKGGRIEVAVQDSAIFTEIVISDNGDGIDEEDLLHLFERFYKGRNSSEQSFGIGLALARMIITNQNGTIKAENNRDKGAKFIIRFYKGVV